MTDLPPNRTKEELLFTYFGVGMFGPFEIKENNFEAIWCTFNIFG